MEDSPFQKQNIFGLGQVDDEDEKEDEKNPKDQNNPKNQIKSNNFFGFGQAKTNPFVVDFQEEKADLPQNKVMPKKNNHQPNSKAALDESQPSFYKDCEVFLNAKFPENAYKRGRSKKPGKENTENNISPLDQNVLPKNETQLSPGKIKLFQGIMERQNKKNKKTAKSRNKGKRKFEDVFSKNIQFGRNCIKSDLDKRS